MARNQIEMAPKDAQDPRGTPPVFSESFEHAIHLLIARLNQWETLLTALQNYFETHKNTSNTLCNKYQDAVKALEQTIIKPSVINAIRSPTDISEETPMKRAKAKLGKIIDKFVILGTKFNFEYAKNGGVARNLDRLKDHAEQMALLEEKQREFLLNDTITKLLKLKDSLKAHQKTLNDWTDRSKDTERLREKAIAAYTNLVISSERFRMNRDMTPLPESDPLLRLQHYCSLRSTWIDNMNNLQCTSILHREECKEGENLLVDSLQTIIHDYIATTKSHNLKIKALFGKNAIPIDAHQEWQHFVSNDIHVPTPPLGIYQPRELRFINDEHPRTIPAAEAQLYLQQVFPWSLRSQGKLHRYVVTHGGYFIKVQEDEMKFPLPLRAFRLRDCVVMECPPKLGTLSFVIKGINCCRDYKSNIIDRRTDWKFTGTQTQVVKLLAVMRLKMPVFGYHPLL